jgi:hypothetical protein
VSEQILKSSRTTITRRTALASALATAAMPMRLRAQEKAPLRIGVLNDQSGPYADLSGLGSVEAAKLAVEDHGGRANGVAVEVLAADHQNKPDIGAASCANGSTSTTSRRCSISATPRYRSPHSRSCASATGSSFIRPR